MDELVFTRETLRRALLSTAESLDKAASKYDPEEHPIEDVLAAFALIGLQAPMREYAEMVQRRLGIDKTIS